MLTLFLSQCQKFSFEQLQAFFDETDTTCSVGMVTGES